MVTVRRWYVFLVCFISLQAVAWAVIALLRGSFSFLGPLATAFQIAVIVIGLPVFLGHWWWAQVLAGRDRDERESALRRLYLYGSLAVFLAPFASSAFDLLSTLLAQIVGGRQSDSFYIPVSPTDSLIALIVLGLLWGYHWWVLAEDTKAAPDTDNSATIRRWYILGFSAAGLSATVGASIQILRQLMFQFSPSFISGFGLTDDVAQLVVGLALWVSFWRWAQQLCMGPNPEERESALRKFYLYASVFVGVLGVVTNVALILVGFFRNLLGLDPQGDLRDVLPNVIGLALMWAYQAYALRRDEALVQEAPRQAGIRRLYWYLVAAVGLAAFLVGVSGNISVLISAMSERGLNDALAEQLAWYIAALIAGAPVWVWPWYQAQAKALAAGLAGADERRSIVRKIYLYFYLFLATMTVLSSLVYIVYRLLSQVLGERSTGNLLTDLAQAIAFVLIAVTVWVYHGLTLRGDGKLNQHEQAQRLAELRVVVVDAEEENWGVAVVKGLQRELPGLALASLNPKTINQDTANPIPFDQQVAEAGLIIGPWNMILSGGAVPIEAAQAIATSPARKLLIPTRMEGWEWVGVDRWASEALVRQTVQAVKQIVAGEEVKPVRPLSAGAILGIIVGVVFLLILLVIPVVYFFSLSRF